MYYFEKQVECKFEEAYFDTNGVQAVLLYYIYQHRPDKVNFSVLCQIFPQIKPHVIKFSLSRMVLDIFILVLTPLMPDIADLHTIIGHLLPIQSVNEISQTHNPVRSALGIARRGAAVVPAQWADPPTVVRHRCERDQADEEQKGAGVRQDHRGGDQDDKGVHAADQGCEGVGGTTDPEGDAGEGGERQEPNKVQKLTYKFISYLCISMLYYGAMARFIII